MPFVIGLTGSIGMGKSTTARMFAEYPDVAVWDADAAVHRLYGAGGDAVAPIAGVCPDAASDKGVNRAALKDWIARDPGALKQIEAIVHPLVALDRKRFLQTTQADIAVLDIPLLFETGSAQDMDMTVVVSTDPEVQRARVLERPGMTAAHLDHILSVQMPDVEKRRLADRIVDTTTQDGARRDVQGIVQQIRESGDA